MTVPKSALRRRRTRSPAARVPELPNIEGSHDARFVASNPLRARWTKLRSFKFCRHRSQSPLLRRARAHDVGRLEVAIRRTAILANARFTLSLCRWLLPLCSHDQLNKSIIVKRLERFCHNLPSTMIRILFGELRAESAERTENYGRKGERISLFREVTQPF